MEKEELEEKRERFRLYGEICLLMEANDEDIFDLVTVSSCDFVNEEKIEVEVDDGDHGELRGVQFEDGMLWVMYGSNQISFMCVSSESLKEIHDALKNYFKEGLTMAQEVLPVSEDERIRKGIIRNLEYLMDRAEGFVKDELKERIAWLENQGKKGANGNDREIPFDAWSEEDMKLFGLLNTCVCRCITDPYWDYEKRENVSRNIPTFLDKLKTLKPQSQWKPSENELEVLRLAAEKDGTCLMGLYENLKKLKGE